MELCTAQEAQCPLEDEGKNRRTHNAAAHSGTQHDTAYKIQQGFRVEHSIILRQPGSQRSYNNHGSYIHNEAGGDKGVGYSSRIP